jgi:hypothetical protein
LCVLGLPRRAVHSCAKTHLGISAVVKIDFAVRGMKSLRQLLLCAVLLLERPEHKFNVLARLENIGGEIRTRAEIFTDIQTTNRHPIAIAALGIRYIEIREHGLIADVLQLERLRVRTDVAAWSGSPLPSISVGRRGRETSSSRAAR